MNVWLDRFLKKHWPVVLLVAIPTILVVGLFFYLFVGAGAVFFLLILAAGSFIFAYNTLEPGGKSLSSGTVVALIGIPLFFWGLQAIAPVWFAEWMSSRYFLWMVLALVMFVWLSSHKSHPAASVARTALGALILIVLLVGAFGKASEGVAKRSGPGGITTSATLAPTIVEPRGEPIRQVVYARPGQPVVGVVPRHWGMDIWHTAAEVEVKDDYSGSKRRRFFFTKPGVSQSKVELWIYKCSTENPCVEK